MWQKNFFSFLTFLLSLTAVGQVKNWDQVYEQSKASIPLLISKSGICSGALIEKDLILTAAHCVYGLRPVSVTWSDKLGVYEPGTTIAMDDEVDLAFVRIQPSSRKTLSLVAKEHSLKVGQSIATIGHPTSPSMKKKDPGFYNEDETYLLSTGVVSGIAENDYITDMSVSPGNSGGPAFNQEGQVVGVVSRKRVGLGVGNIGYVVREAEVHLLKDKVSAGKSESPVWYNAHTSFHIDLRWAGHNFIKEISTDHSYVFSLGGVFDFFDRIRLELETNFNTNPSYSAYSLGYNFAWDMPNKTNLQMTPSFENVNFSWRQNNVADSRSVYGYGLSLMWTQIPIRFKVLNYAIDSKSFTVLSVQLPLM